MLNVMMVYIKGVAAKLRSEEGATAVEYGIMVALIAVAIITAVALLGDNLAAMFSGVAAEVDGATP